MRILIVGLGSIGQRHARNLRALLGDGVELLTVRSRGQSHLLTDHMTIAAGEDVEAALRITRVESLSDALDRAPIATFICNPSALHLDIALAAARAGSHLFIEKPLSHSWDGVEALCELIDQKQLISYVGYQLRFHPCLQRLQAIVRSGLLGRIVVGRVEVAEYLPRWHPYEDYRQMYAAQSRLGGGVVLTQIHELDYLYSLFGTPRRLWAVGGHRSTLEVDVEDTASALLEYGYGGTPFAVQLHADFVAREPRRECVLTGEQGSALMDLRGARIERRDHDGHLVESSSFADRPRNALFMDELQHFLACLTGQAISRVPVSEAKESLRIALAVRESMRTGHVISFA